MLELIGVIVAVVGVIIAYKALEHQKRHHSDQHRSPVTNPEAGDAPTNPNSSGDTDRINQTSTVKTVDSSELPQSIKLLREKIRDWKFENISPVFDPSIEEASSHLWERYKQQTQENYIFSSSIVLDFPLHARLVKYALLQTAYCVRVMREDYSGDLGHPLPRTFGRGCRVTCRIEHDFSTREAGKKIEMTDDVVLLDVNGNDTIFHVDMPSRRFGGVFKFSIKANGPDDCQVTLTQTAFGPKKSLIIDLMRSFSKDDDPTGPFWDWELMSFLTNLFHIARCIAEFGYDPGYLSRAYWERTYGRTGRILYGVGMDDPTPEIGRRYEKGDQTYYVQTDLEKGLVVDDPDYWQPPVATGKLVYVAKHHGDPVAHTSNAAQRDDRVMLINSDETYEVARFDPRQAFISKVVVADAKNTEINERPVFAASGLQFVFTSVESDT